MDSNTELQNKSRATPLKTFGPATLHLKKGLRILHLYGTEEEMAYQHGTLLKEDIPKGAAGYLARKFENEVRYDGPVKNSPLLQEIAIRLGNGFVFNRLIRQMPEEERKIIRALAEASQIPENDFQRAGALPDAMVIFSQYIGGRYFVSKMFPKIFGCTGFAALGPMTKSGELVHGRNLDFPVGNYWDKYSAVTYHYPKGGQKYVSIATAGVYTPGVTAFNESGLILAIQQLFTTDVSAKGIPVVLICARVIRQATNIAEAVSIIRSMKRAGNWAIMLSSVKEKRAVVIEVSPHEVFVREAKDGLITHSNYCFSPRLKRYELYFNHTTIEDNLYRCSRLTELCQESKGNLDETRGIEILGDHFDSLTKRQRVIGRTVSTIYNVQSAFFHPEKKRFWISTGLAPSNLSDYLELPWEGDQWDMIHAEKTLPPNPFSKTVQCEGMREYTKAYHHFYNTKDFVTAEAHLKKALQYDSEEFAYYLALGFTQIKLRHFSDAAETFERGEKLAHLSHYEQALFSLFHGRAYDLLGNRNEARKRYEPYLSDSRIDSKLRRAFLKSFRSAYREKDIEKTIFQFIISDFLVY